MHDPKQQYSAPKSQNTDTNIYFNNGKAKNHPIKSEKYIEKTLADNKM